MGVFRLKMASLALSAVLLATSFTPSQAFTQIPAPVKAERVSDVEAVQYRSRDREYRRGYYRRGGDNYYNGHRGYSYYRRGYREYNGYWFPLAAFSTGVIIGGAIAQPPVRYGGSHVEWCYNRYRSYRAYDNTYQPNYGPRRQCNSPY
ncbi:BA14K family protein [Pararhizobium sp. BT-229]|uniref:BA14K family protein n=1 Tax=Pararhizobium sp. BT-229 TaxID=2986923 RepID=UPI0021F69EB7|nr:BA14K family protein [Pararhizobium sp. BT-229]MCV9963083.1 BA14K family protein [Pararhizobium sp. BT-229]